MPKWNITWRDGFIEGFSTADDTADILAAIQYILDRDHAIEIKITKR